MKSEKPNVVSMFCSDHFVTSSLIYVYVTNDDVSTIKVPPYILFCSHKTYTYFMKSSSRGFFII